MAKYDMQNGISKYVRNAVTKMNEIGLVRIKKYCLNKYPNSNFDKSLHMIRKIAKYGYAGAAKQLGVSKQAAHQTLQKYYRIALEVERDG